MKKTKILAFALAVVMIFSALSVSAFAAYTGDSAAALADGFTKLLRYEGAGDGWGYTNLQHDDSDLRSSFAPQGNDKADKNIFYNEADGRNYAVKVTKKTGDYYLNLNFVNGYVNASNTKSAADYTKAYKGYTNYAGKSFLLTGDFKLDTLITDENDTYYGTNHTLFQVLSGWTVPNAANSSTAFFNHFVGVNNTTGEIVYAKNASAGSLSSAVSVGTGIYLTNDAYTNVSVMVDPTANSFTVYIDGERIATAVMMSDDQINIIAGDSKGVLADRAPVDVTGLTEEEARAKKLANYTPTTVRMFQSPGLSYYADNFGMYTYNKSTVKGHDLTIDNGVLGLNYYLDLNADVLRDANAKVRFTTPRGKVQEKLVKDVAAETNGSYKFTANVSAVEMASEIKMEIVSGETVYSIYEGGKASLSNEFTVKEYAEELLNDATYGKIAKAMLNYGAYAQKYFAAKNESVAGTLANASCAYTTELDSVTIDVADPTQTGTGKKVAKLILDTTTSIVIYDEAGNKIGEKTGINSLNLDTAYEIDCGTSGKVTVSVLAIGEKVLASGTASAEYKALIKALKLFSDASKPFAPQ